ncbi:RidA family protein [Novipirellula artificiosorum]|uniref:Enamine/imine deaminase n=1 Tax=Novipirellula artificiosorum TaxID=2528016 RepID=A0A5C6D396_9BACT|nr:RidA family protein [Novipirellula artificiosorum]TWU31218.1 Enamine/imine deaminase [Novipirellula artificiosorum]
MNKEVVNTTRAPGVIGPFNQGIVAGNMLFTSGQLPMHPETAEVPEGIEAQTVQVLENLKAILEEAGVSLESVVKTNVYLQSMDDFSAMNHIYGTYFKDQAPARACVEVSKMAKNALVEIDAIAVLD